MTKLPLIAILGLVACNDTSAMDAAKAIKLITQQNEGKCVYVSFTPSDIRFNTNSRIYDTKNSKIIINPLLDGFSIPYEGADKDELKQLAALEEEGLVKKVADYINPGDDGAYVSDIENAPLELLTESKKGYQYQLTKLGKSYITSELGSSLPKVCIGYRKVDQLIIGESAELPGSYIASYNIKIVNRPNWVKSPNVQEAFPNLMLSIAEVEQANNEITIVKKGNNWEIE